MKAVLVIDKMPESCEECRLKYLDTGDDAYFGVNVYRCVLDGAEINMNERWDDCPLRPLPRKLTEADISWGEQRGYRGGWNNCLNELLGETE